MNSLPSHDPVPVKGFGRLGQRAALARAKSGAPRASAWSPEEVTAIVSDYFRHYRNPGANKAATVRDLLPHLNNRSRGSVEAKRMNISACLMDLGLPHWDGYKAAHGYQGALLAEVQAQAIARGLLDHGARARDQAQQAG